MYTYPYGGGSMQLSYGLPAVLGSDAGPTWNLPSATQFLLSANGGPDVTATITAAPARKPGTLAGPYNLDGRTLRFVLSPAPGQPVYQIAFAGGDPWSAASVAGEINSALPPGIAFATAEIVSGLLVVVLTSDQDGSGAYIGVVAGPDDAAPALGLTAVPATGSGNVATTAAVTPAELAAIGQAASSAAFQPVTWFVGADGRCYVRTNARGSSRTLEFTGGAGPGLVGFGYSQVFGSGPPLLQAALLGRRLRAVLPVPPPRLVVP